MTGIRRNTVLCPTCFPCIISRNSHLFSGVGAAHLYIIKAKAFVHDNRCKDMKLQFNLRTSFFFLSFVGMVIFNMCSAQQFMPVSNWLTAWKSFAGNQVSAQWIHEQVSEGAQVLNNGSNLVVFTSTEWNSMQELTDGIEEGILEGGSNRMLPASESRVLDSRRAIITWQGTLGGRPMYAAVAAQLGMNGGSQLVINLSQDPINPSAQLESHEIVAFLRTIDENPGQQMARGNE